MFGLELTTKYLGIADKMFSWELTLKRGDRAYTFPYGCGLAHCKRGDPTAPDLQNVLECLQSDARCGAYMLFEDFAREFGYGTDSRAAEKTWRACQEARGQLRRLLGADFEAFESHDFNA
jgi:hypothetical protein